MVFIGKAQEKTRVCRTEKRKNPTGGRRYPWIVRSTALVINSYLYCVDRAFGPFFLKLCTYFPYTAKLCLNGHEYVKRQLAQRRIACEALDNGILACAKPRRLQARCDGLSAAKIEALLRKRRLRLRDIVARIPKTHRYRVTRAGLRLALFFTRAYARLLRPGLARVMSPSPPEDGPLRAAFDRLEAALDYWCVQAKLVA